MFLGNHQHTLDPKGRIILPAPYRPEFKEGLVLTIGMDECVTVHPLESWGTVVENLKNLRATSEPERRFRVLMAGLAQDQVLDGQGRAMIPQRLRAYGHLDREVTVVGNIDHLQIWDRRRWDEYQAAGMAAFSQTDTPFDVGGLF